MFHIISNGGMLVTCIVLELLFSSPVSTYSTGAGEEACDSMIPDHGPPRDEGPPPFEITVSQSSYKPGDEIQVALIRNDGGSFRGFLLQARRQSGNVIEKIGSFTTIPAGTRYNCQSECTSWSGCSVTHENNADKITLEFLWQAPSTLEGDITFRATFVESYGPSVYWADLPLADLPQDQVGLDG